MMHDKNMYMGDTMLLGFSPKNDKENKYERTEQKKYSKDNYKRNSLLKDNKTPHSKKMQTFKNIYEMSKDKGGKKQY